MFLCVTKCQIVINFIFDSYGLLGASGCGKTTVLSAIVGLKSIDDGVITVFNGSPGDRKNGIPGKRVGYMPQEVALYGEFKIKETLQYFGRIHGLTQAQIEAKMKSLTEFLELPDANTLIRNLSGGQQRRVSFAVALLHDPELLILDEPTVGVDPMLRQKIWNHLMQLATEENRTILITTHYIEEARQAHYVGLMRHGKLLAEDSPMQLLNIYSLNTLEEVFLKLCVKEESQIRIPSMLQNWTGTGSTRSISSRKQQNGVMYPGITAFGNDRSIQAISYCAKNPSQKLQPSQAKVIRSQFESSVPKDSEDLDEEVFYPSKNTRHCCHWDAPSMTTLMALMIKNVIKMMRNLTGLLFVFLLPAIEVVFFCVAIGQTPTKLPFALVNLENPEVNNCSYKSGCSFGNLSCRLANYYEQDETFDLRLYSNESLALQAVQDGQVWGYVSFDANYTAALVDRMWNYMQVSPLTRNQSSTQVHLDMSNQQVAMTLQKALTLGFSNFISDLLSDCNLAEDTAEMPLKFNQPIYGEAEPSFTEFMAPGIIIIIIFFLAVALTGEAFISEKQDGLLDRSWVSGVLPIEVMSSHILTQFLVLLVQTSITLIFIFLVFDIPCHGPIGWLILIAILQGFAGMTFGFLLSTVFSTQTTAMQCSIGSFYPILLLSGILWPIEGMPVVLRKISWYLPCTAACQAMRDIMSRGWSIGDHGSIPIGIGVTTAWIAFFILVSYVAIRLKTR